MVALVPADKVKDFVDAVDAEFYAKHEELKKGRPLDELVFVTAPASGATAVELTV